MTPSRTSSVCAVTQTRIEEAGDGNARLLAVIEKRQLTLVLSQEVQKSLVIAGRQIEELRNEAIVPARFL